MIKAVKTTLNTVKLKFNIELAGKWMVSSPKVPRIYGAPKTHKPGKKLRPITSNIDAPSPIKSNSFQVLQVFMLKTHKMRSKNYKTSKLKMMSVWFPSM
jgi:hypothetical protein